MTPSRDWGGRNKIGGRGQWATGRVLKWRKEDRKTTIEEDGVMYSETISFSTRKKVKGKTPRGEKRGTFGWKARRETVSQRRDAQGSMARKEKPRV